MFFWIFVAILACGAIFGEKDRPKRARRRRGQNKYVAQIAAQNIGGFRNDEKI
jgi:hypothetical protein